MSTGVRAAKDQVGAKDATPLVIPPATKAPSNQFVELARKMEPTVVNISTEYTPKMGKGGRKGSPQSDDDEDDEARICSAGSSATDREAVVRDFPLVPSNGVRPVRASSCDRNGYIITNLHVVEKADQIRVKIPNDSTEYARS